jgi:hypothetical protein
MSAARATRSICSARLYFTSLHNHHRWIASSLTLRCVFLGYDQQSLSVRPKYRQPIYYDLAQRVGHRPDDGRQTYGLH